MKIKARVAYRDDTHRRLVSFYELEMKTYRTFIDEGDEHMIDYMYDVVGTLIDAMHVTDCITFERWEYLRKEAGALRGWTA